MVPPFYNNFRDLVLFVLITTTTTTTKSGAWALSTFGIGGGDTSSVAFNVQRVQAGPIEISSIGCGTWSWGNRLLWNYDPSQDEEIYQAYKVVRMAGVSVFDTADSYGTLDLNGRAEILLGQFERRLQEELQKDDNNDNNALFGGSPFFSLFSNNNNNRPPPQQVATKFAPYPWRVFRCSMVNAARASLERLGGGDDDGKHKLALAQLHWSTANYQPLQERALWEGIADVYDAGLCEAVGVSNYGPRQLTRVADFLRDERGGVPLATAQVQYSLMTYREVRARDYEARCADAGCRLVAYSPLCLGLLTGKYDLDHLPPAGNPRRALFRELLPGAQGLLDTLRAVGREVNRSPSQVAVRWTMQKGGGAVPIPGARTVRQAEENLGATTLVLTDAMMDELDRSAMSVGKPMIQNVFQTK